MNPDEIRSARKRLGLSQSGLAEALRLGPNGERTIRRWETGDIPVTGPASVAIELLLESSEDHFPRSRPPKDWVLEKAEEFEAWAEQPDMPRDVCLAEAAKLRKWAEDLL